MLLPWDRSKPSQLELLATEQPAALAAEALPQEVPSVPVAEPSRPPKGEPLLVPLSALCEDPENPRTELQELAEEALAERVTGCAGSASLC